MVSREVLTARNGHSAKPGFIGLCTVAAIPGEGVLRRVWCSAGDLLDGEIEILIAVFSLVVVEESESSVQIGVRVVRDSVGSVGAEGEVVDDGAVAI